MLCSSMIEGRGTTVSWACDLDAGHDGPHRAAESPRSVKERAEWERSQKGLEARAALSEFQGPAETTAERYTVNPTPVPGPEPEPEESVSMDAIEVLEEEVEEYGRPAYYVEEEDGSVEFGIEGEDAFDGDDVFENLLAHLQEASIIAIMLRAYVSELQQLFATLESVKESLVADVADRIVSHVEGGGSLTPKALASEAVNALYEFLGSYYKS